MASIGGLHVIVGDANMAELSTYLKVGTLAIVLDLLEAGADLPQIELDDPVRGIKQVSRDLTMKEYAQTAREALDDGGGDSTSLFEGRHGFLCLSRSLPGHERYSRPLGRRAG